MGAGASVNEPSGYIFRVNTCGCIYGCYYENHIAECVELKKCCYSDLQNLRNREFDESRLRKLEKRTLGIPIDELTGDAKSRGESAYMDVGYMDVGSKTGWMRQADAIEYARREQIRGIEEFIYNTNILVRFGILPTK